MQAQTPPVVTWFKVYAGAMTALYALVVIVGPRAEIEPQLARAGFASITASDPEGREPKEKP